MENVKRTPSHKLTKTASTPVKTTGTPVLNWEVFMMPGIPIVTPDRPPGVHLRDLGAYRLKDLNGSEHLFQVMHPDLVADFPSLKSLDVRANNLPIPLTSFIGRDREIAEVKAAIDAARLVTLTGSGGAGKTRQSFIEGCNHSRNFREEKTRPEPRICGGCRSIF